MYLNSHPFSLPYRPPRCTQQVHPADGGDQREYFTVHKAKLIGHIEEDTRKNLTWFSHRGHMTKCYTESSMMRTANLPVCEASSNSRPTGPMPVIFPCGDSFLREMTQKTKTKKMRASLGRTGPVKPRVAKLKEPVPQIIFFYWNKFRAQTPLIILDSVRHAGRELGGKGG